MKLTPAKGCRDSSRPARLHRLAGRYDNPMLESTTYIPPIQGLWIWLPVPECFYRMEKLRARVGKQTGGRHQTYSLKNSPVLVDKKIEHQSVHCTVYTVYMGTTIWLADFCIPGKASHPQSPGVCTSWPWEAGRNTYRIWTCIMAEILKGMLHEMNIFSKVLKTKWTLSVWALTVLKIVSCFFF
jgi:hypothetical protein